LNAVLNDEHIISKHAIWGGADCQKEGAAVYVNTECITF